MVHYAYTGCVYLAMNKVNGSIYIGKSIYGIRWRKKSHERQAELCQFDVSFHKAIRKYGADNFSWTELFVSTDDASLMDAEVSLISDYRSCGFRLYNMTDGGEGAAGVIRKPAARRPMSQEQKEKLRLAWTPERRAALAERMRNREVTPEAIAKLKQARTGMKFSDSHRENIRRSKLGNTCRLGTGKAKS